MMTTKSWTVFGVFALASVGAAAVTMRRKAGDARAQAGREFDRCERLLRGLANRRVNFR